jgi:hypothetical protein
MQAVEDFDSTEAKSGREIADLHSKYGGKPGAELKGKEIP